MTRTPPGTERRGSGLESHGAPSARAVALTVLAMLAFAGNSLLCRLALRGETIDPGSFTALRLAAGAATLLLILKLGGQSFSPRRHGAAVPALMLFIYAAGFSYAYVSLDAATGALLLFGSVQATMIAAALWRGERPRRAEALGWIAAAAGLGWLLVPGAGAPAPGGAVLMAAAGVAWGLYSLPGRRASAPLPSTAANFLLSLAALPLLLPVTSMTGGVAISGKGAGLAMLSGAVTSGVGYVLWYAALRELAALQAALVQLSVPVITALGGILLLAETPAPRLPGAGLLVLGGIALALKARSRHAGS